MDKLKYVLFLFLIFILSFSLVDGKSYSLNKANIEMYILDNGSINVSEEITFNFDGDFTFAYRDIPKGYWNISNISVYEGNNNIKTEILNESNNIRIKWYFNASNEVKTFKITYILKNAINSYNDVSELNWKIWGDGWELPLNEIFATIYLPGETTPEKVYTYGHPKLDGKIGMLDNNKIILQAFNINSNQFVELRLVFPSELLVSKEYANIKSDNGLQKIIDEEANYGKINWASFIIGLIILIILFIIVIIKSKTKDVNFKDIYFRDIPYNYSPAIVSYLLSLGTPGANISAEVLNLCLKKKMQIEKISKTSFLGKDDYKFIIIDFSDKNLSKSEMHIFNKLKEAAKFGYDNYIVFKREKTDNTPNELLLSEFKVFMQKRRLENQYFIKEWQKLIVEEAKENNLKFNTIPLALLVIAIIVFVIVTNTIFKNPYSAISLVLIIPTLLFRRFFIKIDSNTKLHYLKWKALKKYLKHFSDFNNKEIMDIKLWEKYLVYAIPLGVAKKVQKNMQIVFENYAGKTNSTIFVAGAINVSDLASLNSDFSNAFSSAMATSGASGFSGGSSGGGGGGGGGAG